jgi:hypothetical protein
MQYKNNASGQNSEVFVLTLAVHRETQRFRGLILIIIREIPHFIILHALIIV